jgi:hypothetical protein
MNLSHGIRAGRLNYYCWKEEDEEDEDQLN